MTHFGIMKQLAQCISFCVDILSVKQNCWCRACESERWQASVGREPPHDVMTHMLISIQLKKVKKHQKNVLNAESTKKEDTFHKSRVPTDAKTFSLNSQNK